MPASLFLVRHARTELNADGRLRGRLDVPLDAVGRAEAEALADALAELRPVRVVTSPLRRAVQTAEAITTRTPAPMIMAPGLADREYGQWTGKNEHAVIAEWGSLDEAPGVEPSDAVLRRALAVLNAQVPYLERGPVVLVSHDAVNRLLLAELNLALAHADRIGQRTACWNVLRHEDGRWVVIRVDQTAAALSIGHR
jgi:broad specificity phosphatase PhoE